MFRNLTVQTLTGLAALGVATGVWLGGAAVGEIDPFYFSGSPDSSFVADRMPQPPDWAQVQVGEYQQEGLITQSTAPVPGAVYASPALATYGQSWSAETEQQAEPVRVWAARAAEPVRVWTRREAPVEEAVEEEPVDREWQRVERYASYPISAEEEESAEEPQAEVYAAAQTAGTE